MPSHLECDGPPGKGNMLWEFKECCMEILNRHFESIRNVIMECGFGLLAVKTIPGFRSILVGILSVDDCVCKCVFVNNNFPIELKRRSFPVKLTIFNSAEGILMNIIGSGSIDEKSEHAQLTLRIRQASTYARKSGKIRVYG